MSERDADPRLDLARLRAAGLGTPRKPLDAAAAKAGRSIIRAAAGGEAVELLGWPAGFEPTGGDENLSSATPFVTLMFASCLGGCWVDRAAHPWPGIACSEEDVTFAIAAARRDTIDPPFIGRIRTACLTLRSSLWLDPDPRWIAMGPRVATWSETQIDVLRIAFDRLPRRLDRTTAP